MPAKFHSRLPHRVRLHSARMTILKAHFDGRVLVPDEPVDLPADTALELEVKRTNGFSPEVAAAVEAASDRI